MQSEQLNTTRLLTEFKVLSFDGYGTLIDWETGILEGLRPLLARCGRRLTPDQVLAAHARLETAQEAETPVMLYPDLLARVHDRMALEWGVQPIEEESQAYGQSLQDWPVFLDSAAVLQYFQKYYKLVMISNVDNENFRRNQERLQVDFAWAFTAQDIGSYKPNLRNFEFMLRELAQAGF
jgi:2-haloalkanoic acid dehalogenase type II